MAVLSPSIENIDLQFWNLLYTVPKMEKRVYVELRKSSINAFLPIHSSIRQWSDRKKKIELPLFPRYIFVKIDPSDRWRAFTIKGVLSYLNFGGELAKVKDEVIQQLQLLSDKPNVMVEKMSVAEVGTLVKIEQGLFSGMLGEVVIRNGKRKLLVRVEALGSICCVDYDSFFS